MSWSSSPINGSESVAANKTPLNNAFTYLDTNLKNDHYWDNANSNLDGHHKYVQMPDEASNPSLATDMKAVYFNKELTTNSVDKSVPHVVVNNATTAGTNAAQAALIWASGYVTLAGPTPTITPTLAASYNIDSSISFARSGGSNITYTFTMTFDTAPPHDQYLIFHSVLRGTNDTSSTIAIAGTPDTTSFQLVLQNFTESSNKYPRAFSFMITGV